MFFEGFAIKSHHFLKQFVCVIMHKITFEWLAKFFEMIFRFEE